MFSMFSKFSDVSKVLPCFFQILHVLQMFVIFQMFNKINVFSNCSKTSKFRTKSKKHTNFMQKTSTNPDGVTVQVLLVSSGLSPVYARTPQPKKRWFLTSSPGLRVIRFWHILICVLYHEVVENLIGQVNSMNGLTT